MTDKDLRKLGRTELMEMLVSLSKENEQLQQKNNELIDRLNEKNLNMENAGTMAEAALRLNGIFEAADAAAAQYLDNIRKSEAECEFRTKDAAGRAEKALADAEEKAQKMIDEAQKKAEVTEFTAERRAEQTIMEAEKKAKQLETESSLTVSRLEREAELRAASVENEAKVKSQAYWAEVSEKLENFYAQHQGLRELLTMGMPK